MEAWVVVYRADGSSERHRIEGEQATLGRSPAAGIPLVNCEELLPEHMLLAPRAEGCWVSVAEGALPPVTLAGKPLHAGMVPWGSEVHVGTLRLLLTDRPTAARDRAQAAGRRTSPVLFLGFVALPLAAWLLLSDPEMDLAEGPDAPPPSLFAPEARCPESGSLALARAVELAESASHRADRYPFDAQDGIMAVDLYATAAACFEAAGQPADAERMRRERAVMATRIEEDYRTHRLRRGRARARGGRAAGRRGARALEALLEHRHDDPYASWIAVLGRQLQLLADESLRGESQ
ncbi:MAG: hypothetical protein NZ898_13455 [Myxococcota bacterium]|nr:hypothetical protein [Myxococcota bacterium]